MNVPIVHFVVWWEQCGIVGATIVTLEGPSSRMLWPLLSMWLGFTLFYGAVLCIRGEVHSVGRQAHAPLRATLAQAQGRMGCFAYLAGMVLAWNLWCVVPNEARAGWAGSGDGGDGP